MNRAKNKLIFLFINCVFLLFNKLVFTQESQTWTIEQCMEMAEQNYPLVQQYDLIDQRHLLSIENAQKGILPKIMLSGQASFQSDVTQIPINIPNITIPIMRQEQYRIYGEISESMNDIFTLKSQKQSLQAQTDVEIGRLNVELYQLKERILNLYFGILLFQAQLHQSNLVKSDIQHGMNQVKIAIDNGIAIQSASDNLQAERLKVEQRIIELQASCKAYIDMLSLLINAPIDTNSVFMPPVSKIHVQHINRPEMLWFQSQKKFAQTQKQFIRDRILPQLNVFVQGGIGQPGLNMLERDSKIYYIAGLRLNWNLSTLYTYKNELKKTEVQQKIIDTQHATFVLNTTLQLSEQNAQITKTIELIQSDQQIVELLKNVKNSTQHQLQHGTATSNDYLIAVNAQDHAQQTKIIHEIQLCMLQYQRNITSGI